MEQGKREKGTGDGRGDALIARADKEQGKAGAMPSSPVQIKSKEQ